MWKRRLRQIHCKLSEAVKSIRGRRGARSSSICLLLSDNVVPRGLVLHLILQGPTEGVTLKNAVSKCGPFCDSPRLKGLRADATAMERGSGICPRTRGPADPRAWEPFSSSGETTSFA